MRRVLAAIRAVDEDVTRYAVALVTEQCAQADFPLFRSFGACTTWEAFAFYLGMSISKAVTEQPPEWVRTLLLDLYEYSRLNVDGTLPCRFAWGPRADTGNCEHSCRQRWRSRLPWWGCGQKRNGGAPTRCPIRAS